MPGRIALALFEFDRGTVVLTEAGTKRMASLHLVEGQAAIDAPHVAGMEVLDPGRMDRALSHLLKKSWPRSIDELE